MTRTILSIPEEEKSWLDTYGRRHRISTAEVVRRAIKEFRRRKSEKSLAAVLGETAGTWTSPKGDSRNLIDTLRKDWEDQT